MAIDPTDNTITAGPREALAGRQLWARKLNWHIEEPQKPIRVQAQIRYGHKAADATAAVIADDLLKVQFDQDQYAITPGQAVVLYQDDLLLGGGWIERFAK